MINDGVREPAQYNMPEIHFQTWIGQRHPKRTSHSSVHGSCKFQPQPRGALLIPIFGFQKFLARLRPNSQLSQSRIRFIKQLLAYFSPGNTARRIISVCSQSAL